MIPAITTTSLLRLSEAFPDEINFFCRKFIWASNRNGFYTRSAYFGTKERRPWQPFKKFSGDWQHLYPDLVTELAEKHLDFDRFCRTYPDNGRLRPKPEETAFWLGTMAGDYLWADCLDVDSHDKIGWYAVPTRWHGTGNCYDFRFLPVVRLGLAHFQRLKMFHDHFLNRIWAFSSANLGLALWRIHPKTKKPTERYDELQRQLEITGLSGTEAYPRPPRSPNSLGMPHRRPCGMDSGIITETGIITDPIQQIRCFMNPPPTPSFETVCNAFFGKLDQMYCSWPDSTERFHLDPTDQGQRQEMVANLRADLDIAKDWLKSGCPKVRTIATVPTSAQEEMVEDDPKDVVAENLEAVEATELLTQAPGTIVADAYPACFYSVDLKTINASGQWVQFCVFLAKHGFPCHDKFLEVVSTLAKWLLFVEEKDKEASIDLLQQYCLTKHNGYITRIINNDINDVLSNVERIVSNVIATASKAGTAVFVAIRHKRDNGLYPEVYKLEKQICDNQCSDEEGVASLPYSPFNSPTSCGCLSWTYQPDDTQLPASLLETIRQGFAKAKVKIRKNKNGVYPAIQAMTRLINYLYCGSPRGHRRASKQLLEQMGFPTSSKDKERYKRVLTDAGVIVQGDYRAKKKSRLYCLTPMAIKEIIVKRS